MAGGGDGPGGRRECRAGSAGVERRLWNFVKLPRKWERATLLFLFHLCVFLDTLTINYKSSLFPSQVSKAVEVLGDLTHGALLRIKGANVKGAYYISLVF